MPDPFYGESVAAFVVPMPGESLEAQEVIDYVKIKTAPFKAPHKVTFVEALPKSAVGKILKRELREMGIREAEGK